MPEVSSVPLSELGHLTGRFHLGEDRPLIAMKCFFDGSVGGKSDEWLTLAGWAASDATWAGIQKQWELMLLDRDPAAPYIHMTDMITGNRRFKSAAGWDRDKVKKLLWDALALLKHIPSQSLCAFACAIDTKAHKRLLKEGYRIKSPAVILAEVGLGQLLHWYTEKHPLELAHLFYDQGEQFIRSIRAEWQRKNNPKQLVTDDLFWGRIANVQPVLMKDTPGIQAADIVAWSFTRRLRDEPNDEWAKLATTLIGNRSQGGLFQCYQLDPITEEVMRAKYSKVPPTPPPNYPFEG